MRAPASGPWYSAEIGDVRFGQARLHSWRPDGYTAAVMSFMAGYTDIVRAEWRQCTLQVSRIKPDVLLDQSGLPCSSDCVTDDDEDKVMMRKVYLT